MTSGNSLMLRTRKISNLIKTIWEFPLNICKVLVLGLIMVAPLLWWLFIIYVVIHFVSKFW